MKLYYYIYTGHKNSLEGLRRGAVLYKALKAKGVEATVLLNDFRAGLEARAYGIDSYVTIDTILDVDALAKMGDALIMDSIEDDKGKLELFVRDYPNMIKFAKSMDETSQYGEKLLPYDSFFIDEEYINAPKEKMDRVLFFYGDSDADKQLLQEFTIFKNNNFDLLLGHYFYLGYEDELQPFFNYIYESDEYIERVSNYANVVTFSLPCAIEAKVAGANVVYITTSIQDAKIASEYSIEVIDGLDDALIEAKLKDQKPHSKEVNTLLDEIVANFV